MKIRRILGAVAASAVAFSAVSVCSYAALAEGTAANLVAYEMLPDPYVDYTKVNVVEAGITVKGEYANGGLGVNTPDGEWVSTSWESGEGNVTARLEGLDGIFAPEDGSAAVYVQGWGASPDAVYTIDFVTLYDADGKEIVAGDKIVERPDIKFDDAEPLGVNNAEFTFPGTIDIAQAVGEDFGDIAKITATFKWGEGWNGSANLEGLELADGKYTNWVDSGEIGTTNDYQFISDEGLTEYTYELFDLSENPITGLKAIGSTGEIAGYGCIRFNSWWNGDENAAPEISNITFYNSDGEVVASLDYKTSYDKAETDAPSTDTPADTVVDTDAPSAADGKDSVDTGVEGIAAAAGLAAVAGGALLLSKKRN